MNRRVVITGMGIWACIGKNKEEVKESLYQGKSGIGVEEARKEYGYRSALTGIVERPKLKGVIDRRLRTGLSEEAEYAFMASKEAFEQAGITDQYLLENEVGVIFGNDSSAKPVIEAAEIMREKHDSALLGSGFIFQSMNSTVNMNLSTIFHLKGVNFTVSAACASGSHSIGLAYMLIKLGLQDMVLAGGAQEMRSALSPYAWTNLRKPRAHSIKTATASYPAAARRHSYSKTMTMPWHVEPQSLPKSQATASRRTAAVYHNPATTARKEQ